MKTSFTKANHDYLDSLIANYPMNNYKRVAKLKKQQRKQRTIRMIKDAVAYTVCSIIIISTLLLMACADSIMGCI